MVWSKTDDERKVSFYLYFWRVMVTVVDISDMSPQFVPAWKSLSTLITFILSSSSLLLWTLAQLEHLTIFFSPCIFFMCLFWVLFVIAIDLELTLHNVDSLSSLGDQWDCFQMRKEMARCRHLSCHKVIPVRYIDIKYRLSICRHFWNISISIWSFLKISISISISVRTFWVKNPFFSAEMRVFSCFFDEISISIVDISAFFEISMKYRHLFWEYRYQKNIDKKIWKISISIKILIRNFGKYQYW